MLNPRPEKKRPLTRWYLGRLAWRAGSYAQWRFKFLRLKYGSRAARHDAMPFADDLRHFCCFIGYPRSGHTVVAALLDAHPDIVISDELNAVHCIEEGFSRNQLIHIILQRSREAAATGRRAFGSYTYDVPGQWQGRFRRLLVLGDKQAFGAVEALERHPGILDRTARIMGASLRVLHVTRNPFDNITTWSRKRGASLEATAEAFFRVNEIIEQTRVRLPAEAFLHVRHEDFVADPQRALQVLCAFLGVEIPPGYREACSAVVYDKPHRTRHEQTWPPELIRDVSGRIEASPFLRGYSYSG